MRIALLGDIAFFGKFSIKNNPNVRKYFENVSNYLERFEYVVGNLETPFTEKDYSREFKSAHIKADPVNVDLLTYLKIDAVNLANNHVFDYGIEGYNDTLKLLNEYKIEYFGIEGKELYLEHEKIRFSGMCCYSTNATGYYSGAKGYGIDILDACKFLNKIESCSENGEICIMSVHCGDEHVHYPRLDHVNLARAAAHNPYVFYGHHPHVIQGVESYDKALLAYSLGNFCFDDVYTKQSKEPKIKQTKANKESFILSLEIENGKLIEHSIIPIYDNGECIIVDENYQGILDQIEEYSQGLETDSKEYNHGRRETLMNYYSNRKKKRDLKWYLSRMNVNTVGMLVNAKVNKRKYLECMGRFIENS